MSMRDSISRWKEKRHISHSGIPSTVRPATAWNGSSSTTSHDVAPPEKTIEQALLAAFESDAFKMAIASQLEATITKLNQIKTSNLNLESVLQTHVEEFESHVTISNQHWDALAEEQRRTQDQVKDIPNLLEPIQDLVSLQGKFQTKVESQLNDLFSGQTRLLKSIETRFDGLESRMEELDGKIDQLEESVTNADLRSAIRFGELSNELQDRNTLLGDRIWEMQRDLGKKIDGPQRKVLGVCEELGKNVRGVSDTLETMQEELYKTSASIEATEKALQRGIVTIQEKISNIPSQLDRSMSGVTKELEEIRKMSSSASASSTSQFETMTPALKRIEALVGTTSDISLKLSKSLATTENLEAVQRRIESLGTSHMEKLENAVSTTTRLEIALLALDGRILGKLDGLQSSLYDHAIPLSSNISKLDDIRSTLGGIAKDTAQRVHLDELSSKVSDLRLHFATKLLSQSKSLEMIHHEVTATTHFDVIKDELSDMGKSMADQFLGLESKQSIVLNELGELKSTITSDVLRAQVSEIQNSITQNFSSIGSTQTLALEELGQLRAVTVSNHSHTSDLLSSISKTTTTKEDLARVQELMVQSLATNSSMLEEVRQFQPVHDLAAKVDEFAVSTSAAIRDLDHIIHSTTRSTADEIHEHFRGLDGNLDNRFSSMTEAVHERFQMLQGPVAEVLKQVRESENLLKTQINDEHQATRVHIESSRSSLAEGVNSLITTLKILRETKKEDEIIHRIKSMGDSFMEKQAGITSTLVGMLEETRQRDDGLQQSMVELGTTSSVLTERLRVLDSNSLDRNQKLESLLSDSREMTTEISTIMKDIQIEVQHLKEDPTTNNIKQLLVQNASSAATAYEGILAIDTKIETSQDFIHSAVQEMQTIMGRDILDATSSITRSVNDNLGDVKVDLASRISTSTNVLRAEMKRIDLSQTTAALDVLKDDIQSTSKMAHDDMDGFFEKMKCSVESMSDSLSEVITKFGQSHKENLEQNANALSHLEATRSASLAQESARAQELLDTISETKGDVRMIVGAIKGLEHGSKSSAANLSNVQDLVQKVSSKLDTVSGELKATIEGSAAGTNEAVKKNQVILAEVADLSTGIPNLREEIESLESSISTKSETTNDLLASSIATTSAEILLVKSQIGGVVLSLKEATDERRETDKIHASILSTVKHTSADLHQIETVLKKSDDANLEMSTELKHDISSLRGFISDDNAKLEATFVRELGCIPGSIEKSIDSVVSKLTDASLEATKAHQDTLAVLTSEALSIRDSITQAAKEGASATNMQLADIEKSVLSEMQLREKSLMDDLRGIISTAKDMMISLEGISTGIDSMAKKSAQEREIVLAELRSETILSREAIANEAQKIDAAFEARHTTMLSELENTRISLSKGLDATHSTVRDTNKAIDRISVEVHSGLENATGETTKTQRAVAALQSETKSMSDALMHGIQNTTSSIKLINNTILSEAQDTRRSLSTNVTEAEKSVQRSIEQVSNTLSTELSENSSQSREFRNFHEAKLASMAESINHGIASTQNHVESAHNRMKSELQKATLSLESNLEQLKTDLGSVSKYVQSSNVSVKKDIEDVSGKTFEGLQNLENSIKHTNGALGRRIGDTESVLETSLESITSSMKAVDAAVRVNSAAIARVDKAVLETGSQIKGVVLDGNRDMLFQLDEELHENGTRIRGISEFDIPRIEDLGKRNRVALEVIGARVLGTAKKFDEMIAHHSQKVLEHSELLNGRLRGGSNASSRDSGLRISGILER